MQPILRALHIGVGNRGQWPLRLARPEAGFQPVGLVDPDAKMLAAAAPLCGPVPTFTDLDEALATTAADVAIICSPTRFHVPQGIACLRAGLHVLVEKGMAPNLADARNLVAAAAEAKRALCVAQNYRYQAMERTVARMIADPAHPQHVGAPFLIEYSQNRQRPHPRTLDYPFASVWDMSCHHFDNLLAWLGLGFAEVTARAFGPGWSRYTFPNNTSVQIAHASGCIVHYLHTHNAAINEVRIRVQAERGAIDGARTPNAASAPSTWKWSDSSAAMSASTARSSIAPTSTVPAVPMRRNGAKPAARSAAIAARRAVESIWWALFTGMRCSASVPRPAMSMACATQPCTALDV